MVQDKSNSTQWIGAELKNLSLEEQRIWSTLTETARLAFIKHRSILFGVQGIEIKGLQDEIGVETRGTIYIAPNTNLSQYIINYSKGDTSNSNKHP